MLILPRVTDAHQSSLVKVTLPAITGVITLEGAAGSLFVNNLPATPPMAVTETDVVQLGLTTSGSLSDTVYCAVYVDAIKFAIGSATTADTVRRKNYPTFENVGPFDLNTYGDGYPYYKTNFGADQQDGLTEIDETFAITDRILDSKISNTSVPPEDYIYYFDTVWWVNHYSHKLLRASLPDKEMLSPVELPIGSGPYAIARDSAYNFVVSCSDSNKVLVWDSAFDGAPIFSLDANCPKGISVYNHIAFIAESGSHYVLRLNLQTFEFDRMPVGQGPVETFADTSGIYVTCLDDTLWKIDSSGYSSTHVSTGKDPIGLTVNSGLLYVACSFDNTVEIYDTQLVKQGTIQTHNEPQYLAIGNGQLAVCCQGDNRVEFYDISSHSLLGTTLIPKWCFGVAYYGTHWYVFNGNSGTPDRSYVIDSTVAPFGFKPHYAETLSSTQVSNEVTIHGFDDSISLPCSIAPIDSAVLYKNGSAVAGNATTVSNGDKISVSVTSSSEYNTLIKVPVTVGNYVVDFLVLTFTYDTVVNPMWFEPVTTNLPGVSVVSSEKVVDGLTSGFTTICSVDSGTLFVNGVPSGQSATVENGDRLKIQQTSGADFVTTVFTLGGHSSQWLIYTEQPATNLVSFGPIAIKLDCEPNAITRSNEGLVTTTAIWDYNWTEPVLKGYEDVLLSPIEGYAVYKNGILVEFVDPMDPAYVPVYVRTGDKISFDVQTSDAEYDGTFSYAILDGQLISAQARTLADISPYPILIEELYDTLPGIEYTTDPIYLEGVSGPDAAIPISVDYGTLIINNVEIGSTANVFLHDRIEWRVVAEGPYNGILKYTMQYGDTKAVWKLHNTSLSGAYLSHSKYFGGSFDYLFIEERPIETAVVEQQVAHVSQTTFAQSTTSFICEVSFTTEWLTKSLVHTAQVCNFSAAPKAVARLEAEYSSYVLEFETTASTQALPFSNSFVHTASFSDLAAPRDFVPVQNNKIRLHASGFARSDYGHINLDSRGFLEFQDSTAKLYQKSFLKTDHDSLQLAEPATYQNFALTFRGLQSVAESALCNSMNLVSTSFYPMTVSANYVDQAFYVAPQRYGSFQYNALQAKPHYEMFQYSAVRESATQQPRVEATFTFNLASLAVVPTSFTEHHSFESVVPRSALLDRGLCFKQTDYPAYDGKFSTPELTLKQALINGFQDAEVFLDPDNRYIYRGVCALRSSYNTMGWVRGG